MKNKLSPSTLQLILLIGLSSCGYGTYFLADHKDKTYEERVPCEARFVMTLSPEELKNYELIGICTSKKRSDFVTNTKNMAAKEIQKCACENGGDLVSILNANEAFRIRGDLLDQHNPNAAKKIVFDQIEAKVYRKIK